MNAISRPEIEPDDLVARHMRMCRDLAELGMRLARAVAERAVAGPAEGDAAPAKPAGKTPNYLQLFLRLSTGVRQLMLMEARLAAGGAPRAAGAPKPTRADHRRELIGQALDFAIGDSTERAAMRAAARATLDEKLAADPHGHTRPAAMIHAILDPLGISVSFAKMPSALREALTGKRIV
jgi:hypothetical protein